MTLRKMAADFRTSLAAKISVGGTTGSIQNNYDDDNVVLPTGSYYFTLDADNSQKEHISATLTGVNLTDIKSVSRQGTETTGTVREHRIGASVSITDFAHILNHNKLLNGDESLANKIKYLTDLTFTDDKELVAKKYVDEVAIAGAPDASATVKGIIKLSSDPASPTSPVALNSEEVSANTGANKVVRANAAGLISTGFISDGTSSGLEAGSGTGTQVKIKSAGGLVRDTNGLSTIDLSMTATAGETIDGSTNVIPVYLEASSSKVKKTSSTALNELFYNYIGVVTNSTTDTNPAYLKNNGIVSSANTLVETIGAKTVDICNDHSGGTNDITNTGKFYTQGFYPFKNQTNITSVSFYMRKTGAPVDNLTVAIYAMDVDGKKTGSALGSVTVASNSINDAAHNVFTFASPVTISSNPQYGYVIAFSRSATDAAKYVSLMYGSVTVGNYSYFNQPINIRWADASGGRECYDSKVTYTERTYLPMDPIYLGTTAGTLVLPTPTYKKIIGRIVSATKILLQENLKYSYIGTSGTVITKYFGVPTGTNKMIISIHNSSNVEINTYEITRDGALTVISGTNSHTGYINVAFDPETNLLTMTSNAALDGSLQQYSLILFK